MCILDAKKNKKHHRRCVGGGGKMNETEGWGTGEPSHTRRTFSLRHPHLLNKVLFTHRHPSFRVWSMNIDRRSRAPESAQINMTVRESRKDGDNQA